MEGFEEIRIVCPRGVEALSWLRLPADPAAPVIMHFHGNGSSLGNQSFLYQQFAAEGWGVMGVSYPGYSGTPGSPSERDNVACAVAAFDRLTSKVPPAKIVLYGKSLGTGVAVQVAAKREAAAIILEAPYSAVADIAADQTLLPAQWIMRDKYMSRNHIKSVTEPLLWMHGDADKVIPLKYGERLYESASEPKALRVFEGGSHFNLYGLGAMDTVRDIVRTQVPVDRG